MELKKIKVMYCGEEKAIVVNLRKSFRLSKYRIKMQKQTNLDNIDSKVLNELKSIDRENPDISKLSPEAKRFLQESSTNVFEVFDYDDLVEIVQIVFDVDEEEAIGMLDLEFEMFGFDQTVSETVDILEKVFTNAKDISEKKAISKKELNQVAKK